MTASVLGTDLTAATGHTAGLPSNGDLFRQAFRNHPSGVGIVTGDPGHDPFAMTVSSVASVSIGPEILMFSASALSSSTPKLERTDTVVVHLLSANDIELAKLGALKGSERFGEHVHWDRLKTGEPVYPGVFAWIRAKVLQRIPAGGSTLYVIEALDIRVPDEASPEHPAPLVYHNRTWHALGPGSSIPQ